MLHKKNCIQHWFDCMPTGINQFLKRSLKFWFPEFWKNKAFWTHFACKFDISNVYPLHKYCLPLQIFLKMAYLSAALSSKKYALSNKSWSSMENEIDLPWRSFFMPPRLMIATIIRRKIPSQRKWNVQNPFNSIPI